MGDRFRVYADDDNSLVLVNLATGEAQSLDVDEEFLEIESNYRFGAKIIAWDGIHAESNFIELMRRANLKCITEKLIRRWLIYVCM